MTGYSDEDLRIMADDILENSIEYIENGTKSGHQCIFCGAGPEKDIKLLIHHEECPVLTARAIMGVNDD